MIRRREFEQSEHWKIVVQAVDKEIARNHSVLIGEDSNIEIYRAQGALRALVSLKVDLPASLPDEIKNGKPEIDPVREILKDK